MDAISTWTNYGESVYSMHLTFDETELYVLSDNGHLNKWTVHKAGELVSRFDLSSHFPSGWFRGGRTRHRCSCSDESDKLFIGTPEGSLIPVHAATGVLLQPLKYHSGEVSLVCVSSDGGCILSYSHEEQTMRISQVGR